MGRNMKEVKTANTARVAVYLRVSTEEQANSELGLKAQEYRTMGMVAAKGYDLNSVQVYRDEGKSGTLPREKRSGYNSLLSECEAGKVDVVVVLDISRIARNTKMFLDTIELLDRHGVDFMSVKESFDTSTPQGKFVLTMFAALGQLERDMISERTSDALQARKRDHGYASGQLPFGYTRVHHTVDAKSDEVISIDSSEVTDVRFIFEMRNDGWSMGKIADEMNVHCPSPRGKRWYASTVKVILDNKPIYEGHNPQFPIILDGTPVNP